MTLVSGRQSQVEVIYPNGVRIKVAHDSGLISQRIHLYSYVFIGFIKSEKFYINRYIRYTYATKKGEWVKVCDLPETIIMKLHKELP